MRTTLLTEPATVVTFTATRQPKSSRLGTYVTLELASYPLHLNTMMSIESARGLLIELSAAIIAAETLSSEPGECE